MRWHPEEGQFPAVSGVARRAAGPIGVNWSRPVSVVRAAAKNGSKRSMLGWLSHDEAK
jgi:hypothetical protein